MANPQAHYETTGPELWEQTGGEVDAIVVSVGTGGSISGIGKYFKERKPEVLIVGADPEGSVFTADEGHPVHPYLVEGIGKDLAGDDGPRRRRRVGPRLRPRLVPHRPPARARGGTARRRLVWLDGLGGLQVARRLGPGVGADDVPRCGPFVPVEFYDDNWMIQYGFMERRAPAPTVDEVIRFKVGEDSSVLELSWSMPTRRSVPRST